MFNFPLSHCVIVVVHRCRKATIQTLSRRFLYLRTINNHSQRQLRCCGFPLRPKSDRKKRDEDNSHIQIIQMASNKQQQHCQPDPHQLHFSRCLNKKAIPIGWEWVLYLLFLYTNIPTLLLVDTNSSCKYHQMPLVRDDLWVMRLILCQCWSHALEFPYMENSKDTHTQTLTLGVYKFVVLRSFGKCSIYRCKHMFSPTTIVFKLSETERERLEKNRKFLVSPFSWPSIHFKAYKS